MNDFPPIAAIDLCLSVIPSVTRDVTFAAAYEAVIH